jgi:hypothetical protein
VFRRLASDPFHWDANTVKNLTPAQAYFYLVDEKHITRNGKRRMSYEEFVQENSNVI